MTPERWTRASELFDRVVDESPTVRASLLADLCADDTELRDDVVRLLESDAAAGPFGETPAFLFAIQNEPAAAAALEPGFRLGRYEIVAWLGAGSMGEVYRARDPQLGRDVAIKVLSPRAAISGDQLAWFDREARAAAALQHRNILTVYDVGVDRDISYVVAELLDGETLRSRLQRGRMSVDLVARLALQILSGLAAAHDKGIVHRDLKPENLFLTPDGGVKILDFGLAKTIGAIESAAPVVERGLVMGTAGYMSPEQVSGQEADVRSDLFSFGAVLYEMLQGERAFAGQTPLETMRAVLTSTPAALESLPKAFAPVVKTCLAKDPVGRFASARDVASAIAAIEEKRQTRSRRAWLSGAAIGLAVVVSAVAWVLARGPASLGVGVSGRPALAVLPFEDRSGGSADANLATGASSLFVTALAQTPGLDVIATERVDAGFRDLGRSPADATARLEVARRAGAGGMLVGTLFKAGLELRLDVQVEDVQSGRIIVARSRQGADLFTIIDGLAGDIRTALDVSNGRPARPLREVTTTSFEAYEMYAKAQLARHNNRWSDARTLFDDALRLDPAFTLARAQLVTMLDRLGEVAAADGQRRIVQTQLDRLPQRQRLLTEAVQVYDADPLRAVDLLERLLQQYPDEEEAYDALIHAYGHARDPAFSGKELTLMQRWARAIPGPGSGHFHNHYGYAYVQRGLFTEAEREFRAYIRVSPDEANAYDSLAELFLMTGRPALAVEYYDQALRLNPLFGWSRFGRAYALAAQGRFADASAEFTTLQDLGSRAAVPAAIVHIVRGLLAERQERYREAADQLTAARRLAVELGDLGAEADVDLFAALFAVEQGDYRRAVTSAQRAARAGAQAPVEIMRARRAALAQLLVGVAYARTGDLDSARGRLATMRDLDVNHDPFQQSWQRGLVGEIALQAGDIDEAERAFHDSEYQSASSFSIYPALVMLANNLPFRDGLARTALARRDASQAAAEYRRINRPDVTLKWNSVFDARHARLAANLGTAH
jgi:tetratricopeptide (TPR) repeat protein/TolB-like protein